MLLGVLDELRVRGALPQQGVQAERRAVVRVQHRRQHVAPGPRQLQALAAGNHAVVLPPVAAHQPLLVHVVVEAAVGLRGRGRHGQQAQSDEVVHHAEDIGLEVDAGRGEDELVLEELGQPEREASRTLVSLRLHRSSPTKERTLVTTTASRTNTGHRPLA